MFPCFIIASWYSRLSFSNCKMVQWLFHLSPQLLILCNLSTWLNSDQCVGNLVKHHRVQCLWCFFAVIAATMRYYVKRETRQQTLPLEGLFKLLAFSVTYHRSTRVTYWLTGQSGTSSKPMQSKCSFHACTHFFPVLADSNSSKGAYSTENSSFTLLSIMISMFLMHTFTLSKAFSVGFKCFYNPLRYRNDSYSALAWSSSLSLASIFPSSSSSFSPLSCYFKRFLLMLMGPLSIPFSSVTCS